jgi:arsenate reductase (glutaredoxin)
MIKVYGIKNCNTVKKSLNWLEENNIKYQFHDYKKEGVNKAKLEQFVEKFGWEKVLNRKGTTWRKLDCDKQNSIKDQKSAINLMIEKPSIIKRPIIDLKSQQLLGFDENEYLNFFNN